MKNTMQLNLKTLVKYEGGAFRIHSAGKKESEITLQEIAIIAAGYGNITWLTADEASQLVQFAGRVLAAEKYGSVR
jgi:hypothetical protein